MNKTQISLIIFAALWMIFAILFSCYTSNGEEIPQKDWVDVVGEHIGGWEQQFAINGKIDHNKMTVHIRLEDGNCYEYFILLKESGHEVFYRDCGEKSYDKLN